MIRPKRKRRPKVCSRTANEDEHPPHGHGVFTAFSGALNHRLEPQRLYRRFVLVDPNNEKALEQLIAAKDLTREDIQLILETIQLNAI